MIITRYAQERLLYRLAQSEYGDEFILKGALMFLLWSEEPYRPTQDLDLLGFGPPSTERLISVFRALCYMREEDGLEFDPASVAAHPIREQQEYGGIRVSLTATLERARVMLAIDVGFGDAIIPAPETIAFPTLLQMPAPRIRAYPREAVVAEKFEAMVTLGIANSRMKDFCDVWVLCTTTHFDEATLAAAIQATFDRRGTTIPSETPVALSEAFAADAAKQAQWGGFLRRARLQILVGSLEDVVADLRSFLGPLAERLASGSPLKRSWEPGGPWA